MTTTFLSPEPIAIVGMGCRFPGESSSPSKFWDLLHHPRDVSQEIPGDRFNSQRFYHADGKHHGTTNVRRSYFLSEDIRHFDTQFFGIAPAEAEAMDPQHRVLLEVVYEAMESSGTSITKLSNSDTAVYVGLMCSDYYVIQAHDMNTIPTYNATGVANSNASSRISYFFDWHGPSMTIDTACSSSLVALHEAVQTLRSKRSRVAFAAGTNLLLSPLPYVSESKLNMLSPTGRSRMWDADADGYARGEGVAAVMLKTLSAAIQDGDRIEGVIRETGINQDGRTKGITMPSAVAQAALIRDTYARAGLDPTKPQDRCQYFEAHGTGTPAGDPQEAEALSQAFFSGPETAESHNPQTAMLVGSVKTVIGHTEGTAGLAGLIKVCLALKHGVVPPNMLFSRLNPALEPFVTNLRIPTSPEAWPALPDTQPRRASVNSFGFGGTNAHAILENYKEIRPEHLGRALTTHDQPVVSVIPHTFSAASKGSLLALLESYLSYLKRNAEVNLTNLSHTLITTRSSLGVRAAVAATTHEQLREGISSILQQAAEGDDSSLVSHSSVRVPSILGVFTGQGAQWPAMGKQLITCVPKAMALIESLDRSLGALPEEYMPRWSLVRELLADGSSRVQQAEISQPLCTAVQVLLVDLLSAAGIRFSAVVGHSSGEIAAAYAAGFISAHDAIRIAYLRGHFAKSACGPDGEDGLMMAVGTSISDANDLCDLDDFRGRICVAAHNSPDSVTLSGDVEAIQHAKRVFDEEGKFARILKVDTAYHSHHLNPAKAAYRAALQDRQIQISAPNADAPQWYSSVHAGQVVDIHDQLADEYWVENMRNPVWFAAAVEKCLEDYSQKSSLDYIVEVGPHPALMGPVKETIRQTTGQDVPYTGTLRRGMDDIVAYQTTVASLWNAFGTHAVDLAGLEQKCYLPDRFQNLEDLPQYAWSHDRLLWAESRSTKLFRTLPGGFHDLLGVRTEDSTEDDWRWRNVLKTQELPWLSCHALQGQTVFPGTGYIALAMEAALQVARDRPVQLIELRDLKIRKAIAISDNVGTDLMVTLTNVSRTREGEDEVIEARYHTFSASNKDSTSMALNTSGDVRIVLGSPPEDLFPPRTPPKAPLTTLDIDRFYSAMRNDLGYMYDGPFRGLRKLARRLGHSSGVITNPGTGPDETQLLFHPGMLDNALQGLFAAYSAPGDGRLWSMRAPTACRRITLNPSRCGPRMTSEVAFDCTVTDPRDDFITGDVDVYSADFDSKIIEFEGLSFSPFAAASEQDDRCLFQQCVEYVDQPDGRLVLGDRQPSAPERQKALDAERVAFYYLKSLDQAVDLDLRLSLPWYRQSLLDNASRVVGLVRDGAHPYAPPSWLDDSEDDIQAIMKGYGDHDPDFNLTRAVGENLPRPSVLTGETNILEYMTQNNYLDNYYTHAIGFDWLNDLISGTISQLTCKFPHMKICEIGAGTGGATQAILEKVGNAFASYTYTDISSGFFEKAQSRFQRFSSRLSYKVLDIERDPTTQGFEEHSFDLVLAANVLHATACLEQTLHNVRKLLRPGGFLVLMEIVGNDVFRIGLVMGGLPGWWVGKDDGRRFAPTVTLEQWDSLFRATEFSGIDTYTPMPDKVQMPGSVFVTQAVDTTINKLREPQHFPPTSAASSDLVILGGSCDSISRLVQDLVALLKPFFKDVIPIRELTDLPTIPPRAFALSLLDCDGSLFEKLDEPLWESFKALVSSLSGLLWVTTGSRLERPYAGVALGLLRSLIYEIPETGIQCLDVGGVSDEGSSAVIARLLLQMQLYSTMTKKQQEAILWTPEPELILAKNRLHMVRVQPQAEQNDRYNSFRRQIMKEITLGTNDLRLEYDRDAYVLREKHDAPEHHKDYRTVQVQYSLLSAINANDGYYFPCLGIRQDTCEKVLCLSTDNSSIVTVPQSMLVAVNDDLIGAQFMSFAVADLVRQQILNLRPAAGTLLIHEPDPGLASLLSGRTASEGQSIVFTTCKPGNANRRNWIYVHERTPARTIDALIPREVALIIDLSSTAASKYRLGARIASLRPQAGHKLGLSNLAHSTASTMPNPVPESIGLLLEGVAAFAQSQLNGVPDGAPLDTFTVGEAVTKQLPGSSLALVEWDSNQSVPVLVEPITVRNDLFQGDKTYWLAGLAGDMGQSLADFMIQRGARHIALSSRNPVVCLEWQKLCKTRGAQIEYFTCDLSLYASVQSALSAIESKMPRIAGVANGALVLRDTPVATMSFDALQTVLNPKVAGTLNLDRAFAHHALDWFIAFSSIVGTTGNMGQAAYSAANCFMKALVNNRRNRGLAGSVIDISRVIGVGYVERETKSEGRLTKEQTERLMNRTGTIPMSEPDLHQLFMEAVVAGLPGTAPGSELITGLAPIGMAQAEATFWAANPKFGLLVHDQTTSSTVSSPVGDGRSITQIPVWTQLQDATSPQEVSTLILAALGSKLRASLFLSATDPLSPETPLVDFGIDSLVAVELRTWVAKELSVDLPVLKILGGASILDLVTDILEKLPGELLANATTTVPGASSPNPSAGSGRESPLADSSIVSASYDFVSVQSPPTTAHDSDGSEHGSVLKSSSS